METEGNLETMVVDLALLEIPEPRIATAQVAANLITAFERLCERDKMHRNGRRRIHGVSVF